jgi:hypothetical protein
MHLFGTDCSTVEIEHLDRRSRTTAEYSHAMKLITQNRGAEALPLLLNVAERLLGMETSVADRRL